MGNESVSTLVLSESDFFIPHSAFESPVDRLPRIEYE